MRQIPQSDGTVKYLLTEREVRRNEKTADKAIQLAASNVELLAALELAQVSALKLAHMAFVCSAYAGRMDDVRGEVDNLRVLTTDAIAEATP